MAPRRLVMAAAVNEQIEVQLPFHRAGPCWCLPPILDGRADAPAETYAPTVNSGKTLAQVGWTRTVLGPNRCTYSRFLGYIRPRVDPPRHRRCITRRPPPLPGPRPSRRTTR